MSQESEFRAHAAQLDARAETADYATRKTLHRIAASWLLLANIEARPQQRPTRWDHLPSSAPRGAYS